MLTLFFFRSLYIQGLNALQDKPEDFFLSYFQIAGIHGRKYSTIGFHTVATPRSNGGRPLDQLTNVV